MNSDKTQAIDLSALMPTEQRPLIGWLVIMNGPDEGRDFRLYAGSNRIGNAADGDIVISDGFVSATHCVIRHERGQTVVRDMDSLNGTRVNGRPVARAALISNDELQVGQTRLWIKLMF